MFSRKGDNMSEFKEQILKYSRQETLVPLSIWFDQKLDQLMGSGDFMKESNLAYAGHVLDARLQLYSKKYGINKVVVGMSGGVDSALTAALFKEAGWDVTGVTMPIHQNPNETNRGIDTCKVLGINHKHIDLTNTYEKMLASMAESDPSILNEDQKLRRGNLRVRLRMMTIYNQASAVGGLVASTDNFSELAAGFWTLHGDVGDLGPIQSLNKSWEVPKLAEIYGVPSHTVFATPTDGLGISESDESQFGFSYLEFDIVLMLAIKGMPFDSVYTRQKILDYLKVPEQELAKVNKILDRVKFSAFKRQNPYNLSHPILNRYSGLASIDYGLWLPD